MILLILVKLVFFCETGDSDESGDSSDSSDSGYYGYSGRKCEIWWTNNASKKGKRVVVVWSTICKILKIVTHKKTCQRCLAHRLQNFANCDTQLTNTKTKICK